MDGGDIMPVALLLSSTACASLGLRPLRTEWVENAGRSTEICVAMSVLCTGLAFGWNRHGLAFAICLMAMGYLTARLLPHAASIAVAGSWFSAGLMLSYIELFVEG